MAYLYQLLPQEQAKVDALRLLLAQSRKDQGLTARAAGLRCGASADFVYQLETKYRESPRLSSWQRWAQALGWDLRFMVQGFCVSDFDAEVFPDLHSLFQVAALPGAGQLMWRRLFLVAQLRAWRVARGVDVAVVAQQLGVTADGAARWEVDAVDPILGRVLVHARAVGAVIDFELRSVNVEAPADS